MPGILKFVMGDRCAMTLTILWQIISGWVCFLYITDGYKIYPCLIEDCDHKANKIAMTRIEGDNCPHKTLLS